MGEVVRFSEVMDPTRWPSAEELRERILDWEDFAKDQEQVDIPVTQYFCNGVYVREITIPAGVICTGAIHKHPALSVVLTGEMEVVTDQGPRHIKAPMVFESPAGVKRAGRAISDCRWLTIHPYAGDELDKDAMLAWLSFETFEELEHKPDDREDFQAMLSEFGYTLEIVQAMTLDLRTYAPIPCYGMVELKDSPIAGRGLFARIPFPAGARIMPARVNMLRTQAGRYVNHAARPNAACQWTDDGDIVQVALVDIGPGEEITNDYRANLALQGVTPLCLE